MSRQESPYDKEVSILKKSIEEIEIKLAKVEQRRADYLCPYKVGQMLVNSKGRQAKIVVIKPARWNDKGYDLTGYYVLANGTLGKVRHELYSFEGWVKA